MVPLQTSVANDEENVENNEIEDNPIGLKRKKSKNTVEQFLDCLKGEKVKANYLGPPSERKAVPQLDAKHRTILTELIINGELTDAQTRITTERFEELASEIVKIFPNERKSTYYIAHHSVKTNGKVMKKHAAAGKLLHKYNNEVKSLMKSGVRSSKHHCRTDNVNFAIDYDGLQEGTLQWLGCQRVISQDVIDKWQQTSEYRFNSLSNQKGQCHYIVRKSGKCHVNSYMSRFPFLRQANGYSLLENDFGRLYPAKVDALFTNWPHFVHKVKVETNNESDRSDVRIILDFCNIVTENISSKRVTKHWVANKAEIIEGFIVHVTVIDSLQDEITRICERAVKHRIQVSPFLVVVGVDLDHITDAYMYIDGVQYRAQSVMHAVDQCMKAVHALHAVYQEQSEAIWLLFQRILYGIQTPWDHVTPVIEAVESRFK